MMRLSLLLATFVFAAAPAVAQSTGPIEIGFDASISRLSLSAEGLPSSSLTVGAFPLGAVRVGVPLTRYVSIEPAISLLYFNGEGDDETAFSGEVGALVHLTSDRRKPRIFLRPFIGYDHDSFTTGSSGNRMTFGGGLGASVPTGDRFAFRFEGRYRHYAAVDDVSLNSIGLVVGLSFFTK